jgi:hypothetical protein
LTTCGTAKQLDVHPKSLGKFLRHPQFRNYLGKLKQDELRLLLDKRTKQQFGKDLKHLWAEHAALKVANGGEQ